VCMCVCVHTAICCVRRFCHSVASLTILRPPVFL